MSDESKAKAEALARHLTEQGNCEGCLAVLLEKLYEALESANKFGCGCHSSNGPKWHSDRCFVPKVREALALFDQPDSTEA